MDARSKKAWGFVAAAGFAVFAVARIMMRGEEKSRRGIVSGGRDPRPGQRFRVRRTPTHRHQGIDVAAPKGSGIYAAQEGRVAARWVDGTVSGYGNTIVLQHPDGTQTLYAHMDSFAPEIRRGGQVRAGQRIGSVGQTQLPRSPMRTAPHLHFETHLAHSLRINENNPERMDPLKYLAERGLQVPA